MTMTKKQLDKFLFSLTMFQIFLFLLSIYQLMFSKGYLPMDIFCALMTLFFAYRAIQNLVGDIGLIRMNIYLNHVEKLLEEELKRIEEREALNDKI